ncbi:MAG: FAD-dependent oxidoreductase [Actinobacteria bacterium]|nr:FAD-dependent oxidoreductase [Actinomycetota bacterium]
MGTGYDIIVLGAGPAGLTAGIYAARARRSVLVLDSGTIGGQMVLSYKVANYPGVAETSGRELSQTMAGQARAFGAELKAFARIARVDLGGQVKTVTLKNGTVLSARAVIIASGGVPRKVGVDGEERFVGRGISYCATCDGDFFTGRPIAVIGGGNSALEEAVSLSQYASRITVIHEFDHFQAEPWAVAEAKANDKISFLMNQRVLAFIGESGLAGVRSADKEAGAITETPVDGCFVFVGYVPNSEAFEGQVKLTERGEVVTDEALSTNLAGVFAAGDVRHKRVRQITTAAADGTVAALSALEYLSEAPV